MRRAGPDVAHVKKTSMGSGACSTAVVFPEPGPIETTLSGVCTSSG
jgi:hypothetical protein